MFYLLSAGSMTPRGQHGGGRCGNASVRSKVMVALGCGWSANGKMSRPSSPARNLPGIHPVTSGTGARGFAAPRSPFAQQH
jgi:hypothetical protein